MDTMFDTLLQLPLFQGLAHEDFTSILEKVKLHFTKHKTGEIIAACGDKCDRLIFVLKGTLSATSPATDRSFQFTEQHTAPCLLEPYSMFGMYTTFSATYTALEETHTICISKRFVMNEMFKYEIFRLNYLNIICNRAQKLHRRLRVFEAGDVEDRIIRFIADQSERPTGEKSLKIKMEELARICNETRMNVSKTLNSLQNKGLVELHRGEIVVPQLELLTKRPYTY